MTAYSRLQSLNPAACHISAEFIGGRGRSGPTAPVTTRGSFGADQHFKNLDLGPMGDLETWQCGAPQQNTGLAAADPEQKDPRHRVPQTPSARVRAGNRYSP